VQVVVVVVVGAGGLSVVTMGSHNGHSLVGLSLGYCLSHIH